MHPPFDVAQQLQKHGQAMRQLAGELVRDANVAEDAVQEVWLAALQRPPQHDRALGGWFATAVRNVVSVWRRKERRRAAHEQLAATQRGGGDPGDGSKQVAREELGHRLLTAVEALDAPYRAVIWQRYFEGMAPRDIAAQRGVPVETVKSQLKRGLALLRERFGDQDRDGGDGDWRFAFVAAFGLRETTAAATAVTTGGVLVTTAVMWTKSAVALGAAALAVFLCWPHDDVVTPSATARVEMPAGPVAVAPGGTHEAGAAANASPSAEDRVLIAAEAPPPVEPRLATIRGRCVDETGLPLAGIEVRLTGSQQSRKRMDEWLRDHPKPDWTDPAPIVTGLDGAFEFVFAPPPPWRFFLDLAGEQRAQMTVRWRGIEPGARFDLGDVVMPEGVTIVGRVVDDDGAPCPSATWAIERTPGLSDAPAGTVQPHDAMGGPCLADGSFVVQPRFAVADYLVRAWEGSRSSQKQLVRLNAGQGRADVTIPLPRRRAAISGRVLDEQGALIRGAEVHVVGSRTSDGLTGEFNLERAADDVGASASLQAFAEGFEAMTTPTPIAWGTNDVELRLERSGGLIVTMLDEQGHAVNDASVRCAPVAGTGHRGIGSRDSRVRARGPFPNGVVTVPGVSSGRWRLVIEFPADADRPTWVEVVEVPRSGLRHVVRVMPKASRALRVVTVGGKAVVGSRVQLVERSDESAPPLVHCEGQTGSDGRLQLRGPGERPLSLRLLGPGHVPLDVELSRLTANEELVVEVASGARFVGRIEPTAAMAELVRLAAPDRLAGEPLFAAGMRPTLQFASADGTTATREIADDGTFAADGLGAGPCKLTFRYGRREGEGSSSFSGVVIATIVLVDGAETHRDIELAWLLPGELHAQVLWNGRPAANAGIMLRTRHMGPGGVEQHYWINHRTDGDGNFRYRGRPGAYELVLSSAEGGSGPLRLLAPGTVDVGRDQIATATFRIVSGELELRVHDAAGAPVRGCRVYSKELGLPFEPTDEKGIVRAAVVAGTTTLCLPGTTAPGGGAAWSELRTVTVNAGETVKLELRLPPSVNGR